MKKRGPNIKNVLTAEVNVRTGATFMARRASGAWGEGSGNPPAPKERGLGEGTAPGAEIVEKTVKTRVNKYEKT